MAILLFALTAWSKLASNKKTVRMNGFFIGSLGRTPRPEYTAVTTRPKGPYPGRMTKREILYQISENRESLVSIFFYFRFSIALKIKAFLSKGLNFWLPG